MVLTLGVGVTMVLGAVLYSHPQPDPVICRVRNETEENIFVHVEGDPPFPTQIFSHAEQRITTDRGRTEGRTLLITDWEGRAIRRVKVDSVVRDGNRDRLIIISHSDRLKAGLR